MQRRGRLLDPLVVPARDERWFFIRAAAMLDEGGADGYATLSIAVLRLGYGGEETEEVNGVHLEALEVLGEWGRDACVLSRDACVLS